MNCDELVDLWPIRWPRPDPDNTVNTACQVRKFGRDFAGREPSSITRSEARSWSLLNPGTARYVRTMFNDLLDDKLIGENPFAGISIPSTGSTETVVPTIEQVNRLVDESPPGLSCRILFAAETGLRYAEQKAVLSRNTRAPHGNAFTADFTRLRVEWQMGRGGKLKRPKTRRGVRSVMVNAEARHAARATPAPHAPYLWPLSRKTDTEQWTELRRATGIWIRWHDLRHYHATQLLDAGAKVEDVAVQLGCRDDEIRDTYGHPDDEKALQRLEGLGGV